MSEIETVTIEHGNSSVTMSGKDFAAATDPRTSEMENVQCLRCDLTREELDDLANRLAEEQLELQELEEQKKAVAKDFAGRIEAIQARIKSGSNTFRQKWEMRDVDCIETKDFDRGICFNVRMDTGETIKSRKLTNAELERCVPISLPQNVPER